MFPAARKDTQKTKQFCIHLHETRVPATTVLACKNFWRSDKTHHKPKLLENALPVGPVLCCKNFSFTKRASLHASHLSLHVSRPMRSEKTHAVSADAVRITAWKCHRFWKCYKTFTFCSLLTRCTIPCTCHAKRHLNVHKWSEPLVFLTF